jgi:hypothetical protein
MEYKIRYPYATASRKQIKYAEDLGLDIPPGIKAGELSELIDAAEQTSGPTPGQLKLAERRGVEFPEGATCALAAQILSGARLEQSVTDDQLRLAERLGVRVPEGMRMVEMSWLLDEAIAQRTKEVLESNKAVCVNGRVIHQGRPYSITHIGMYRRALHATLEPLCLGKVSSDYRPHKVRVAELHGATHASRAEIQAFRLA